MPVVAVPPPYRGPTGGEGEIQVDGATVKACLDAVDARHPGFGALIFTADGSVHRFVRLFVNEDPVAEGALDTPVGPTDEINVVAAIGGG